jgi:hypothetical protein
MQKEDSGLYPLRGLCLKTPTFWAKRRVLGQDPAFSRPRFRSRLQGEDYLVISGLATICPKTPTWLLRPHLRNRCHPDAQRKDLQLLFRRPFDPAAIRGLAVMHVFVFKDSLLQVPGHTGVQRAAAARHGESGMAAFVHGSILRHSTWAGSGERKQLQILPLRVRMTAVR